MPGRHSHDPFDRITSDLMPSPQVAVTDLERAFATFDEVVHERTEPKYFHTPQEMIDFYHSDQQGVERRTRFEHRSRSWFQIHSEVWDDLVIDATDRRLPSGEALSKMITAAGIYYEATRLLQNDLARVDLIVS